MGDIVVVEQVLLKSAAFRSLNGTTKTVYFDFLMKCRVKGFKDRNTGRKERVILNNGELEYCYSEAEARGITRPAFVRAIDDLNERGLLDVIHQGEGGRKGDKSLYAISERWRKWGTADFDHGKRRAKDTRQGRGFAVYWKEKNSIIGNENVTPIGNENVTPKSGNGPFGVTETLPEKRAKKGRKPCLH